MKLFGISNSLPFFILLRTYIKTSFCFCIILAAEDGRKFPSKLKTHHLVGVVHHILALNYCVHVICTQTPQQISVRDDGFSGVLNIITAHDLLGWTIFLHPEKTNLLVVEETRQVCPWIVVFGANSKVGLKQWLY